MIDASSAELSSQIAMSFAGATPPQDTLQLMEAVERENGKETAILVASKPARSIL
jgi:hypothetical protein